MIALLASLTACGNGPGASAPTAPPVAVVVLEAHRDATALFGGRALVMSFEQDWDQPGPLKLSRGKGPVERTFEGWPVGVAGDRAYFARRAGAAGALELVRVGLTGEPEVIGAMPAAAQDRSPEAAVTGDGHVIARLAADRLRVLAPDGSSREVTATGRIAAAGPRAEVALVDVAGALALVDAATGAVRWSRPLGQRLSAVEGEAGFTEAGLVVHLGDELVAYDLATGAPRPLATDVYIDARNTAFAPRGGLVAFSVDVHPSDIMPISMRVGCDVRVVGPAIDRAAGPVRRFESRCYFGTGLVFVDGELWIAPR